MRKYLHIEIKNGALFVYADNTSNRSETYTLEDLGRECMIDDISCCPEVVKNISIKIPIKDLANSK